MDSVNNHTQFFPSAKEKDFSPKMSTFWANLGTCGYSGERNRLGPLTNALS